ncbi:hypothetical protein C8Q79DRAFT_708841 [Trametes meyenii]|nr:hypothetical protein C8Q79DRAFT_708841 [Trametes meyenii]
MTAHNTPDLTLPSALCLLFSPLALSFRPAHAPRSYLAPSAPASQLALCENSRPTFLMNHIAGVRMTLCGNLSPHFPKTKYLIRAGSSRD